MTGRQPKVTKITHRVQRTGKCPGCGKTVTRSRSFTGFNPEGQDSLYTWASLVTSANHWEPDFTHARCTPPKETR